MATSRRRLLQAIPLSMAAAAAQDDPAPVLKLSEERLRMLRPVLKQRQAQLARLRDYRIDDAIRP